MKIIVILVAVALLVLFAMRFLTQRVTSSPEYNQAISEYERKRNEEDATLEVAPWIGTTGLDEAIERELPQYLRREFGEFLEDGGLKASDLEYLGKFSEPPLQVHYWRIPRSDDELSFAYVEVDESGKVLVLGWGDKEPKGVASAL